MTEGNSLGFFLGGWAKFWSVTASCSALKSQRNYTGLEHDSWQSRLLWVDIGNIFKINKQKGSLSFNLIKLVSIMEKNCFFAKREDLKIVEAWLWVNKVTAEVLYTCETCPKSFLCTLYLHSSNTHSFEHAPPTTDTFLLVDTTTFSDGEMM